MSMNTSVGRTLKVGRTAALAMAMLLLVACGGSEETGAEQPSAEPEATAPGATEASQEDTSAASPDSPAETAAAVDEDVPDPVVIGIGGSGSLAFTATYVAQGQGYLEAELAALGTTAEVVGLEGSVGGIQAVLAGDVHYTASVTSSMLNAIAEGAELTQVAQFLTTDLVFLTATPGKPTDVSNPAVLVEGQRWGIPDFGASAHVTALKALDTWGYDAEAVEFVTTGHVQSAIAAVEQDLADYYWIGSAGIPLIEDGTLDLVLDLYDPETVESIYGGPYATSGLFSTPSFLEAHPETTAAVVRAHVRALEFITENADDPQGIAEGFPDDVVTDSTAPTLVYVAGGHSATGEVLEDAVQRVIDSAIDGGLLEPDQTFDLEAIVDNSYLN